MTYRAPVADIAFALKNAAGFGPALAEGLYGDLADDVVEAVLEEAGKFATDILAPLNAIGDRHGARSKTAPSPRPRDGRRPTAPGRRPAGTGSPRRRNGAARSSRTPSTPPASKCGTRPPWRSASARC